MSVQSNISEALGLGASATTEADYGQQGALRDILAQTSGSAANADKAIALANQLVPQAEEADPWAAAFKFFAEMGKQASKPGATVLGSAVSSMSVPFDYLQAKKAERNQTEQARLKTALSLGPSLKAPVVKATYSDPKFYMVSRLVDGKLTEAVQTPLTAKQFDELQPQITDGSVVITAVPKAATAVAFKQRTFFRTGFDPVVAKSQTDADAFEANENWTTLPPDDWKDSKGGTNKIAAEVQSSKILDGGVVVTVMKDGTTKVIDASGKDLEGDARADAIEKAEERGSELQGNRSQQRGLGAEAAKAVSQSYADMLKVRDNIATLEDAKRALESGAKTGYFQQFLPNITQSAAELQNVRLRLGLDVVSSITFGALSEKELGLALDTGLPESMDETYLKKWVQDRIDAKKKLLANLSEAAKFLSKGNSIGDWIEEVEKRETASQDEITPLATEISTMSKENMITVDVSSLSNAELQAYIKRKAELE